RYAVECRVVTVPGDLGEFEGNRGLADLDRIAGLERNLNLSVDRQHNAFGRGGYLESEDTVGVIDEWPVGERMGADGRDHEGLQFLPQQWSAGREAVCRRAVRRADDQAVAAIGGDVFA